MLYWLKQFPVVLNIFFTLKPQKVGWYFRLSAVAYATQRLTIGFLKKPFKNCLKR